MYEESEKPGFCEQRYFGNAIEGVSQDVKECFEELFSSVHEHFLPSKKGNDIIFNLSMGFSCARELILENCEDIYFGNSDYIDCSGSTLVFNDGTYTLTALRGNTDEDDTYPIVFRFKNVRVEQRAYNAIKQKFQTDSPWGFLSYVAFEIIGRSAHSDQLLNEKEIVLMPLLNELCLLNRVYSLINYEEQSVVASSFSCGNITGMPVIKGYCDKYGLEKQKALVEKLEKKLSDGKDPGLLCDKLCNSLNNSTCESAWREIYNLISESQAEYPNFTDYAVKPDDLASCRAKIQAVMQENGFEGKYPDFYRTVDIKSPRMALCDGEPFLIFAEKNVKLLIHCEEQGFLNNSLHIDFLTAALRDKKDVNITDIFSCFFHHRGKVFTNSACWSKSAYENEVTVDEVAQIACKKAELKRLTKKEKENSGTMSLPIRLFVLMGVAFGALFCLLMAIFCFILCVFLSDIHQAWEITVSVPWWQMFLFSGGAFGVFMYIAVTCAR